MAKGLIELKHNKVQKKLYLRVGADNPLDKIFELKSQITDRFFKIDLKRFKFEPVGKNKFQLSLINRVESLGQHIDLTLSFLCNWKIDQKGIVLNNFTMKRFTIPFFPHKTTRGIRKKVSQSLKNMRIKLKHFPGSKVLVKAVQYIKSPQFAVQKIERSKTKFVVQLQYIDPRSPVN